MRILAHADDGGLSCGITGDIEACSCAGSLSGVSIIAGGEHAGEAIRLLKRSLPAHGAVPAIGVHLNLLEGRCLLPPERLPHLVRPDGFFRRSLAGLSLALSSPFSRAKQALLDEIAAEWTAQAAKVRDLLPSSPFYLDGHLHVHTLPALRPALFSLLESFSVTYVRVPDEPRHWSPAPFALQLVGNARRELLRRWSRGLSPALRKRGVRTPDCFISAFYSGCMTMPRLAAELDRAQKRLPDDALTEIMFHPGALRHEETDAARTLAYRKFYLAPERARERALLCSPAFHRLMLRYDKDWRGAP
jgi:predicted glycoside hydrolase/deacetylase ChbG (UPF0249 family)